jgi:SHS2 domain-containing protein
VDVNSLLVDFLSEVLYLSQNDHIVFPEIKIKKFSDYEINGDLLGCKIPAFSEDIKGVTYHELDIRPDYKGIYRTIVVFDI